MGQQNPAPVAPQEAPRWAASLVQAITRWVDNKFAGPLSLTGYSNLPAALANARSLIWNKTTSLPQIADDSAAGVWLWLAAYSSGAATAVTNAGTINTRVGKLTTESLTTAAGSGQVLTITNSKVAATDHVFCSVANLSNTGGLPYIGAVTPGAGSCTVDLRNVTASGSAFNGTLVVSFWVVKA